MAGTQRCCPFVEGFLDRCELWGSCPAFLEADVHCCHTLVVRPALSLSVGSTTSMLFVGFAHALLVISLAGNAAHLLQCSILENQKHR